MQDFCENTRRIPNVPDGVILGVLTGLRDPDPKAAASAFASIAGQTEWNLNQDHWRVFLMAARFAHRTGDVRLRRQVARAMVAWSHRCPDQFKEEQSGLLGELGNDICWSVRNVVKRQGEE